MPNALVQTAIKSGWEEIFREIFKEPRMLLDGQASFATRENRHASDFHLCYRNVIISLHIRSMWETICDAWACWSGWKFGPNSTEYPYSEIQFQNTPPPQKWKLSEILALWLFSFRIPPPENWNLGRSWHFVTFQFQNTPPPRKLKFRQILALCHFSVSEYPPSKNWNLGRSWHFVTFQFQNIPPPKIEI